ncbi:MAG: Zn-ribbon domain-containing OB-fold protein [Deltaproteobacteria bacterium]|nr:Zn-ribbon domain-containing OB-fold protein [Deltaproteobacteria bacterium]
MEDQWRRETKPIDFEGGIFMPYSWTVGRVGSRFFIELRDNGRIMASACRKCKDIWVPPRMRCPVCFSEIDEDAWVEIGPEGTLRHYTVVRYDHKAQPIKPPFAYAIIDLDGATRGFTHLVYGTELEDLKSGTRLKPVFALDPQGNILDIEYFTPVGGQGG